jgi:hypothetical protein
MTTRAIIGRGRTITLACVLLLAATAVFPHVAVAAETPGPLLSSISASAGAPGDAVTLTGSGFGAAASETSYVVFSGVRAKTVSWSDTQVVALVPERCVPGYVGVTVDNVTTNGKWFSPNARPRVNSLSKSSATAGTSITIFGSGFGRTQRNGWVTFGGRQAPVVSWSDTQIVAMVPSLAEQLCWVGVWQNGAPSNGVLFMPFLAPQIDSMSAMRVKPGQQLTLRGKRFGSPADPGAVVRIGGMIVDPATWTDTQITFAVPADAPTGYVGVWRCGASSNGRFVYVAPQIESISKWWVEPGETLTIDGQGFSAATRVTIGGAEVPVLEQSNDRIVVRVTEAAKEGYVGVWNGGAASNGIWVLPMYRPRIDWVSATSGQAGMSLTIRGRHFGQVDGNGPPDSTSRVRLGALDASVIYWTDSEIGIDLPYESLGVGYYGFEIYGNPPSGYLGVWRHGIASNGVWVDIND